MTSEPACKGSQNVEDHDLELLGDCPHAVGGTTYVKRHQGCRACGAVASETVIFACGTRKPAVRPTAENCLALKWKADRTATA